MKRLAVWLLGAVLAVPAAVRADDSGIGWLEFLSRAEFAGKAAKEALDRIDEATRKTSDNVLAEIRNWDGRAELTVARLEQALTVEYTETNWRGTVTVQTTVPCILHYAMNLNTLGAGDFRFDPASRYLYVRMPEVRIQAVEPDLSKAVTKVTACTGMRFQFYDAGDAKAASLKRVTDGAREKGQSEPLLRAARAAGKEEAAKLFRKVLKATRTDGDIIIE